MTLRVGDRVVRVHPSAWPREYGEVGGVYEVISVSRRGSIQVIEGCGHANAASFKLASSRNPKKKGYSHWISTVEGKVTDSS